MPASQGSHYSLGLHANKGEKENYYWIRKLKGDFARYLHRRQLDGSDAWGIHHRLGPVGRVRQQAVPLLRQPRELLLPVVKASVNPVLEVRGPGNFQPFLLLAEHGGKIWRSHGERKKNHLYDLLQPAAIVSTAQIILVDAISQIPTWRPISHILPLRPMQGKCLFNLLLQVLRFKKLTQSLYMSTIPYEIRKCLHSQERKPTV